MFLKPYSKGITGLSYVLHITIGTFKPVHSAFFVPAVCLCVGRSCGENFTNSGISGEGDFDG